VARCYHCGKILEDAWLKRQGAALMGKASGESKARSPEMARKAALARWEGTRKIPGEIDQWDKEGQPQSLNEELAQEKHRRKFVQPLKKPIKRKRKQS
jgi:hypothetical protein